MQDFVKYFIGIVILILGIPLGHYLAKITKDELKSGQRWFKLMVIVSFICAIISAVLRIDALLFGFLFIAIVTSRSLKR